jgi:hypothetical protein
MIAFSSCFASDYKQDAYEYLSKHPRTTEFHSYNERDNVISFQHPEFPYKIVRVDNQYDVLHIESKTPESLFSKMIRFIRRY